MGADGWISIYDIDKGLELGILKERGTYRKSDIEKESKEERDFLYLDELSYFQCNSYFRNFFGHRILHVYDSTEIYSHDNEEEQWKENLYEKFCDECYIDTWEVWT